MAQRRLPVLANPMLLRYLSRFVYDFATTAREPAAAPEPTSPDPHHRIAPRYNPSTRAAVRDTGAMKIMEVPDTSLNSTGTSGEVTRLLGEISRGDKGAMNELLPLVYDELHRLARAYFRRERGEHTLQPTALVHEAYLRLVDQRAPLESRGHFMAVAATQMRRILLDYARKHHAARRGGDDQKVLLEDTMVISEQQPVDVIALNSALEKLAKLDSRQARLVELRFFGGLTVEETAEVLEVSPATVKRSWSSARAFLHREITGAHGTGLEA